MPVFLAIFLSRNSSLIKSQNLLENPLLFPTQITNLLFVIKNRQPLKQNFRNFDSENFGLVFPKFSFFEAK
ncbi:MAG: hypothetical protein BHW19_11660 [Eubacterium sp. 38_16]|nr:MAG: hypothetical protein BHW19_11660 [Eubacterium sp. 38_16]